MTESSVSSAETSAALRKSFDEYESANAFASVRRAAVFTAIFMLASTSLDWIVLPKRAPEFMLIRAICVIFLALIYWDLGRTQNRDRAASIARGIALLPIVSICLMIGLTEGGNSIYYAGLNLTLVGLSLLLRWSFRDSLVMIVATFAFYSASVWLSPSTPTFQVLFGNTFFIFVTSAFVLVGSYFYEELRLSEFKLRMEVEKSRGLLEVQNRQLSEMDEVKTRFFANISHELRTPLTIMIGITERLGIVLGRQFSDPAMQEMTGMLEQNGLRLLKLVDDLLDLVRLDTDHVDITLRPIPIHSHLDGLLRSVKHLAEQDRVTLKWDCHTDSDVIQLDRDKFDKILLNLVMNAIKFTPVGGTIDVKLEVAGNRLLLTVEDSGVGISASVLPQIFERFWQVDTSSTRKFQGTGIGLALVRSLTEAMGGEVKVDSQLSRGTLFTVSLPVVAGNSAGLVLAEEFDPLVDGGNIAMLHRRAALSSPSKNASKTPSPDASSHAAPLTGVRPLVLIADDEPDIRRFLKMQLEDVEVIEASDGAEALDLVRNRLPQLVLLDYMMPEVDGVEVCRRIREDPTTRGVAVIVLTARADEVTKMSALRAGANDFLTKPFSTAELALRLDNQISMARIRREMIDLNTELQTALEQIKENEAIIVRNEKLAALGRMSAGIIHEINNPLNYASAGLHALDTFTRSVPEEDQEDYIDILKDIREGVERVSQIVIDLRKFTHDEKAINGDADLAEVVGRAKRMVGHQVGKEIEFQLKAPHHAPICGNPNQLVQVFINFFQNSIDAIQMRIAAHGGDAGRIDVSLDPSDRGWLVTIRDNGIGIPPEDMKKIFDPFFTSKEVGKGMGLGLSITHRILLAHDAVVEVESRPAEFTRFQIAFPAQDSAAELESIENLPA
jgi:signal transduction histidine kinase